MPRRPPREWMHGCETSVQEGGGAVDPGAVCAATWQRKSPHAKHAAVAAEEPRAMTAKKKKKKSGHKTKLHGAKLAAWNRKHHPKKAKKKSHAKKPRAKKRKTTHHKGESVASFLKGIRKTASGR